MCASSTTPESEEQDRVVPSGSKKPALLFVDYSTNRKAINSHVQKESRKKKKAQRITAIRGRSYQQPLLPEIDQPNPYTPPSTPAFSGPLVLNQGIYPPDELASSSSVPQDEISDWAESLNARFLARGDNRRRSDVAQNFNLCRPGIRTYFDTTADQIDPFQTSGTALSAAMNKSLRYYMETLNPRYWLVPSRCRLLQQQIMQFGLAGSSTMYAMLAVSAVFRKDEFLPNKFKAVEALNVSLANTKATDDISELLFCINNLLVVEGVKGSAKDIVKFVQGIVMLLDRRGGLEGLPAFIIEHVLNTPYKAAIITEEMPLIPPPPYTGSVSLNTFTLINNGSTQELQTLCMALLNSPVVEILAPEMVDIIWNLRDVFRYREHFICNEEGFILEEIEYINRVDLDAQYCLIGMRSKTYLHPVHEVFRIALLMCSVGSDGLRPPGSTFSRAVISQLRTALDKSDMISFWEPAHEAFVWVLCLGGQNSEGEPENEWFATQLARGLQLLGLDSWDALRSLLLRHIFLPRVNEAPMRRMWHEADSLREAFPDILSWEGPKTIDLESFHPRP